MKRFAHLWRSQRMARWLLILTCFLLLACSDPPPERIIERFENLTSLLETNKNDPDKLLKELEGFVAEHKDDIAKDREELEALSIDEQKEYEARYEKDMRRALEEFLTVTLEVQDRLRSHPDKLIRFQKLLGQLR